MSQIKELKDQIKELQTDNKNLTIENCQLKNSVNHDKARYALEIQNLNNTIQHLNESLTYYDHKNNRYHNVDKLIKLLEDNNIDYSINGQSIN